MKYSEWIVPPRSAEIPSQLTGAGFTPLVAALLSSRGIETAAEAEAFLVGGADTLGDPMLLADMEKAAARVRAAIENKEHVAVFGDYDVDGITSCCLVTSYLRSLGITCEPYIPDRIGEGYGLNTAAIASLARGGATLIITVDCGITAREEAAFARSLGVDMVITDHHECAAGGLPEAVAVVDPKRPDCDYPNSDLAGVGVAFKLLSAVSGDAEEILSRYADLIATGTVADVMPLTGENRYIVRRGLDMLCAAPRPGLEALLREAGGGGKPVTASTIGFLLAPRINAAGRLGQAYIAEKLLLTQSAAEANELASRLCTLNRERQELEQRIFEQAHGILEKDPPSAPIVLANEGWHQGVIGIAASKLAEEYALPTVMICLDGEAGKGSCRSCGGFNLFDALSACSDLLEGFGGHALAAGLTIKRERVDDFRAALGEYYKLSPGAGASSLCCDLLIGDPDLLSMECVESLSLLEPYGTGNPRPTLVVRDMELEKLTPIGGGKHLRLQLAKGSRSFEAIMFSRTAEELGVRQGARVDAAFFPQINEFRGRRTVQLLITDVRPADESLLCRSIAAGGEIDPWDCAEQCPTRADFIDVWRWLQKRGGEFADSLKALSAAHPRGIAPAKLLMCLRVMSEAGLVELGGDGDDYRAVAIKRDGKADLESSPLMRKMREYRKKFQ